MIQVKKMIAFVAATAAAAQRVLEVYEKYKGDVKEIKGEPCSGPTVDA